MLRKLGAMVVTAAFVVSSTAAFAGTTQGQSPVKQQTSVQQQGALAPGGAAGVQKAQVFGGDDTLLILAGVGLIGGGLALVLSGNSNGSVSTTTTGHP